MAERGRRRRTKRSQRVRSCVSRINPNPRKPENLNLALDIPEMMHYNIIRTADARH